MIWTRLFRAVLGASVSVLLVPACELFVEELPEPVDGVPGAGGGGAPGVGGARPATGGSGEGGTSGGCPTPCDCDGDGAMAESCAGGDDCDDQDAEVNPRQTRYFTDESMRMGFDYDCDQNFTRDPSLNKPLNCTFALAACPTVQGYLGAVPECGQAADWGACKRELTCVSDLHGSVYMACR